MKKILSICDPEIKAYHFHGDLLSVIQDHEDGINWIMNNYIQLTASPETGFEDPGRIDYYFPYSVWKGCPLILYNKIGRDIVEEGWSSIIDFIISSIDLGYYVYLDIDRYFISGTDAYKNYEDIHDIFIYGYDSENEKIYFSEFIKNNVFKYTTASFKEFKYAYISVRNKEEKSVITGIELIKKSTRKYKFDLSLITKSINDYLNSTNSIIDNLPDKKPEYNRQNYNMGMKVYKNLKMLVDMFLPDNPQNSDIRGFYVVWEHKKHMLKRISYLSEKGYLKNGESIYNEYSQIESAALIARNMIIKYFKLRDNNILKRVSELIDTIEAKEKAVLGKLLSNMSIPDEQSSASKIYESENKISGRSFLKSNIGNINPVRGDWYYSKEGYTGDFPYENSFALSEVTVSNFIYEANITLNTCTAAALMFRADNYLSRFYCATIDISGKIKLWKPWTEIAVVNYQVCRDKQYHLKVDVQNDTIKIYIDDVLAITANDSTSPKGYLGVNIFQNKATFQDIYYSTI